jgi:WD40 repeat protein
VHTKKHLGGLLGHSGPVTCLFGDGDADLYSGGVDGEIKLWDTQKMSKIRSFRAHKVIFFSKHYFFCRML